MVYYDIIVYLVLYLDMRIKEEGRSSSRRQAVDDSPYRSTRGQVQRRNMGKGKSAALPKIPE